MVSVALFRSVWWMACRSARFVTALVLMALLLSGGAAGFGQVGPSDAAGPLATTTLSSVPGPSREARPGPPTGAADLGLTTGDPRPTTDGGGAAVDAPTNTAAATGTTASAGDRAGAAAEPRSAAGDGDEAHPVPGVEPAALGGPPDAAGRLPGTGPRTWPTGDAYPRTSGPRAPPLG